MGKTSLKLLLKRKPLPGAIPSAKYLDWQASLQPKTPVAPATQWQRKTTTGQPQPTMPELAAQYPERAGILPQPVLKGLNWFQQNVIEPTAGAVVTGTEHVLTPFNEGYWEEKTRKAQEQGVSRWQAAGEAWRGTKLPSTPLYGTLPGGLEGKFKPTIGVKGAVELSIDPLNWAPGVGMVPYGKAATAVREAAPGIKQAALDVAERGGQSIKNPLDTRLGLLGHPFGKEVGMPEPGMQANIFGERPIPVTPAGKGVPTQIGMEDALKLKTMQDVAKPPRSMDMINEEWVAVQEEIAQHEATRDTLSEVLRNDPIANYKLTMKVQPSQITPSQMAERVAAGEPLRKRPFKPTREVTFSAFLSMHGGEFPESVTIKEAEMLMQGSKPRTSVIVNGRVPTAYVMDRLAQHFGISEQELIDSIKNVRTMQERIGQAENALVRVKQESSNLMAEADRAVLATHAVKPTPSTPLITPAESKLAFNKVILKFEELPDTATFHLKGNPYFKDSLWSHETVPVDSLEKPRFPEETLPQGPSLTTGPIVVGFDGEIVNGNHRLFEAIQRGDKTIEVYRELPKPTLPAGQVIPKVSEVPSVGKSVTPDIPKTGTDIPIMGKEPPIEPPKPPVGVGKLPEPKPEFAGNIRLEKYSEEVRPALKEWADAHPDEIVAARRSPRTDVQLAADAATLADEIGSKVKSWKPGKVYNDAELKAMRGALSAKTDAVMAAKDAVRQSNSTENLLKLVQTLDEQTAFQEALTGGTSEAGRALRQFRQQVTSATGDSVKLERLLKQVGGRDKVEEIARLLGQLDVNDPVSVNQFIRNLQKPGMSDYVTELYYNSILSGPKTHIVNSLSNTLNAFVSPFERAVAAAVDIPLSKLQGRKLSRLFSEVPADAFGAVEGIKDGVRAFGRTMKTGISPEQASKYELQRTRAFTGKFGRVVNLPSTALEAADAMMYQVNYRAAFKATAKRMSGGSPERYAELLSNPTKELMAEADHIAEYRLYRQEPGKTTSAIMGLRESISIGGFKPLRYIVPFIRTPANLLKYGLERSPAGWLNPKLWKNIAIKNPEAADQIARAAMGSVAASALAWYVLEGKITGAAPTNPAERDRFYRDGKQPFSVRIGNKWVSYQRLEPFNQTFGQVAAAIDALKANDKDVAGKVAQAVSTISQNLVSQTYMSGLSNAIDMISQPERYAGDVFTKFATALGTPMSSATRTVAQVFDPTVRQPGTLGESFKAGIPGLSQQVPAKIDVFGQEVTRKSPAWSPINITPAEETTLTKELDRLKYNIGFVSDVIGGVKLDRVTATRYQQLAGNYTKQAVAGLILTSTYKAANDVYKEKLLDSVISNARERAKYEITRGAVPPVSTTTTPSTGIRKMPARVK